MAKVNGDCPAPIVFTAGVVVGILIFSVCAFVGDTSRSVRDMKYQVRELRERADMERSNIQDLHTRLQLIEKTKESKQ